MSLLGALAELVDSGEGEVGPKVLLSARSEEVTLLFPSRVVHHLKMIARESVTNAMKHSGSEIVEIDLRVEEEQLILTISDDGSGFDFGSETRGKSGHFGCMGMRERARKIEAEIEWRVSGSGGTMVEVCMPLKAL